MTKLIVSLRYFVIYCSLVLIYVLTFSRTNSSSILLRKNMFNFLLAFFLWKHVPSEVLKYFSV